MDIVAPSPTIPTSFVPKQPVKSAARFTKSGGNTFLMFSLFALGLTIVGAIGVFAYGAYLKGVEQSKAEQLREAELTITSGAVEDFVRARSRFEAAGAMLDNHVAVSNFFNLLEEITLVNVRYSSFTFGTLEDGTAEIGLSGTARSFNALAAQSSAFSNVETIRRAIFSGIQVEESGAVSFNLEAQLDADLLAFTVEESPAAPVETAPEPAAPATSTPAAPTAPSASATSSAPRAPTSPAGPTTPAAPVTPPQL
jgi:hypothetical protein